MNKTESALVRKELKAVRSLLNARAKSTARELKKRRDIIRTTEREITAIEREAAAFTVASTDRLAILTGRLG